MPYIKLTRCDSFFTDWNKTSYHNRFGVYMIENDTIAAIATSLGCSGIGIVRMSGTSSENILGRIFRDKKMNAVEKFKSHKMVYGFISDPEKGEIIDEVLAVLMKAPNSYTKEDTVEINCHGGMYTVRKILEVLVKNGARLAEPGEFTKRAFMNGRIDLTQAEAVIDLINARTEANARNSLAQLQGSLFKQVTSIRRELIGLLSEIEATIDFPEYDIEHISKSRVSDEIERLEGKIKQILMNARKGKILKEGINTAIVGKPNVGKSSLLNELTGEEKAIVTEIPGTTRDVIEEYIEIGGIPLRVYDTAGIRDTEDVIEKIGVERAEEILKRAELVLLLLDGSQELNEEDKRVMEKIKNNNVLILINKSDLRNVIKREDIEKILPGKKVLSISVKERKGINELEKEIKDMFFEGKIDVENDVMITNIRQKELVEKTAASLMTAYESIKNNMPLDCVTIDIKNAAEYLGQITGEAVTEDVIHEIFSRFCIGK